MCFKRSGLHKFLSNPQFYVDLRMYEAITLSFFFYILDWNKALIDLGKGDKKRSTKDIVLLNFDFLCSHWWSFSSVNGKFPYINNISNLFYVLVTNFSGLFVIDVDDTHNLHLWFSRTYLRNGVAIGSQTKNFQTLIFSFLIFTTLLETYASISTAKKVPND